MELDRILQKVREAISEELEIEPGTLDDNASLRRDYKLDSVAAVNIIFFLERELGIEIKIERFAGIDSIADLKHLLAEGRSE